MKTYIKNKLTYAFTMIELVFVIVIVGIISVMIAPSFQGNNARQAADQIVSHIRYAQHLAMMDNKFDSNTANWFTQRWHITFATDSDAGSTDNVYWIKNQNSNIGVKTEYASDPLDSTKILSGDSTFDGNGKLETLNITSEYGVTATAGTIYFDNIGRPLDGVATVYGDLLQVPYDINITDGSQSITIRIEPETGYTHILPN